MTNVTNRRSSGLIWPDLRAWTVTLLVAALTVLTVVTPVHAQELSNRGDEFIISFLPNFSTPNVELHLTGANTDVTIQYPVNSPTFNETVSVTAGDITIVSLPNAAASNFVINDVADNAVRLFSEDGSDFVAYMINRAPFTSDAGLALPVNTMNVDYVVATYLSNLVSGDRSQFAVVAAFNNTTVEITPANAMGGTSAGDTRTVMLDRGEVFLGRGNTNGPGGDLTGTIISADRPVGVTNGNLCANVPGSAAFCDHIFQIAHPTQTWGRSIPVANLANRTEGSIYRILAAEDDTEVFQDGSSIGTIDRNEFLETPITPGNHVFSSEKEIFVVQFMTGSSRPGTGGIGDPAMGNMVPDEQYLTGYTFSTVGDEQFEEHVLTIIADNADIGANLTLNASIVDPGLFTAIPGTNLSAAVFEISEGVHNTSSIQPHGITVAGYNNDDSYMYAGGARFEFIAPGEDTDPPICEFTIVNNEAHGSVRDDRPEDSGVFFVRLMDGAVNVSLAVEPFTPGDPVVNYVLSLVDSSLPGMGVVEGIDGSGNRCQSAIELGEPVDVDPDPCDDLQTLPSWDGTVASNGDGTGSMVVMAPLGLARVDFYNSENLMTDLSGEGFVEDGPDNWIWDGAAGEEPTSATVLLETIDKTNPTIRFWVRLHDTCPRVVDLDPVIALGSDDHMLPMAYMLEQNYPNPFNPNTQIRFQIPEATQVNLVVYDLMGREVTTLMNQSVEPGTYSVIWNGTNAQGESVSSGIYLYRLEAGDYSHTNKMTFMK